MAQRYEGQFEGFDQTELFFQTWTPATVRGVLILTHGLAEHSECYHNLARQLADDGWLVYGWDMRGHGRSEGKRGYVADFKNLIKDLNSFYELVLKKHPGVNLVFFGHSLGALVTMRFIETYKVEYSALALSSPCLALSFPVPPFKELLARVANRILPTLTLYNEIKYEDLSRDEEEIRGFQKDTLRHDKISPALFLGMVANFPLVLDEATQILNPVLMQVAGDDHLVNPAVSREVFDRLPNKKGQFLVYPESYHEIFHDLDRDKAVADLKKFLNSYLGA